MSLRAHRIPNKRFGHSSLLSILTFLDDKTNAVLVMYSTIGTYGMIIMFVCMPLELMRVRFCCDYVWMRDCLSFVTINANNMASRSLMVGIVADLLMVFHLRTRNELGFIDI